MSKVASSNRKRISELSDYQLRALINSQKKKMKEAHHDSAALLVAKNSISRLKKELERRKAIQS